MTRLLARFGIRMRREEVLRPGDVFRINMELLDKLVTGNVDVALVKVVTHEDGSKELHVENAKTALTN